jgi:hypothetical protein
MTKPQNVIHADFKSPRIYREKTDSQKVRTCKHFSKKISMEERIVYCASCNTRLDPLSVLAEMAERDEEMVALQWERLKLIDEIKKLSNKKNLLQMRARSGQ